MKKLVIFCVLLLFLLFTSCNNKSLNGRLEIIFRNNVTDVGTRTIQSNISLEVKKYNIEVFNDSFCFSESIGKDQESFVFHKIPAGCYCVQVNAVNDYGIIVGNATQRIIISVNSTTSVSMEITELEGYGIFNLCLSN